MLPTQELTPSGQDSRMTLGADQQRPRGRKSEGDHKGTWAGPGPPRTRPCGTNVGLYLASPRILPPGKVQAVHWFELPKGGQRIQIKLTFVELDPYSGLF